jgi:hypothetical protein
MERRDEANQLKPIVIGGQQHRVSTVVELFAERGQIFPHLPRALHPFRRLVRIPNMTESAWVVLPIARFVRD